MDKIRLDILGLSASQTSSGSFALILGERGGNRRLPIVIGMFEAQAIAIEIEQITPNRPMTHDLFRSLAENFKINITEIVISELREGVFFAHLACENDRSVASIDARPSDAIAIALRFGVPIFTTENVLSEAGIILTDNDDENAETIKEDVPSSARGNTSIRSASKDELEDMLKKALENEDYEGAARIRDEMSKRM